MHYHFCSLINFIFLLFFLPRVGVGTLLPPLLNISFDADNTTDDLSGIQSQRNFCLGTENGRTLINVVNNLGHYARLKMSFKNCRRIVGNLEITHIPRVAISAEINNAKDKDAELVETIRRNAFYFLEDVEEITGYLLIYNVQAETISLPKLKIIWGEQTHEGNGLQVDSNFGLRILSLPSLRTIEEGNLTVRRSAGLCYFDTTRQFVDFSEILGESFQKRLNIDKLFNVEDCKRRFKGCDMSCKDACFGPKKEQCQTIYRRDCKGCESHSCYFDDQGSARCCDSSCTGGCSGGGRENCTACKRYEQDGKCVNECSGTHSYHQKSMVKQELPNALKRYYYGRHCIKECPAGTLIEEKYCVARCSEGHFRDVNEDDQRCIPCREECPKVCQINEPINSMNIQDLVNCSEIEGNLLILNHAFIDHHPDLPPVAPLNKTLESKMIPALTASDLDVLKTVKIVTGYIAIEGGSSHSHRKPTSLAFLENLEMIEGRKLYHEKYSLYVMQNFELKWLGLRSLRKVKQGAVLFQGNRNLCYSYTIPFERLLRANDIDWRANKNPDECENSNRKCDSTCDLQMGCWGPGPSLCVRCKNYIRDGICADSCPELGYFVSKQEQKNCIRCHDQCLECTGSGADNCLRCRNFEYWTGPQEHLALKCVAKCPNSTYTEGKICKPCHKACYEFGCQGSGDWLGNDGCVACQSGVEDTRHRIRCLIGEMEEDVCRLNGLGENYFLSIYNQHHVKYMCRKCRAECRSCRRDSALVRDECECANFRLIVKRDANANLTRSSSDVCVNECGKGSYIVANKSEKENSGVLRPGLCRLCHPLCDHQWSCRGSTQFDCDKCRQAGLETNGTIECLDSCPKNLPFPYEGMCHAEDKEMLAKRTRNTIVAAVLFALMLFFGVIGYLVYRCTTYRKKYIKEAQMHLPEIPPIDPRKITQRPNMRRLNLIDDSDLVYSRNVILGDGAFGVVYPGRYKPLGRTNVKIAVAIKAIRKSVENRCLTNEQEMLREAGLMAQVQHEHLLPFVGISFKGGLKIVTLLRVIGSLSKFLVKHKSELNSKNLILYCYQISSAMEYLARRKIVHRDLATRNVLVKNINHVEVTDFGLAAMLTGSDIAVVIQDRVAVRWLAIESLRNHIFNEKTDVWSFGVTCWEIMTLGLHPYKEVPLTGVLAHLDKGGRLPQPQNCTFDFYQEILKCWLEDPNSRPSFKELKQLFNSFCAAPHLCLVDRNACQRLASIADYDQRMMTERLLKDSDFVDPTNLDPTEYMPMTPGTTGTLVTELSTTINGTTPVTTPAIFPSDEAAIKGVTLAPPGSARMKKFKREQKLISVDTFDEGSELVHDEFGSGYIPVIDAYHEGYVPTYFNNSDANKNYVNQPSNVSRQKSPKGERKEVNLITLSPSPSLSMPNRSEKNNNTLTYIDGGAKRGDTLKNDFVFETETCF